jgi:hypothetical protein
MVARTTELPSLRIVPRRIGAFVIRCVLPIWIDAIWTADALRLLTLFNVIATYSVVGCTEMPVAPSEKSAVTASARELPPPGPTSVSASARKKNDPYDFTPHLQGS